MFTYQDWNIMWENVSSQLFLRKAQPLPVLADFT